MTAEKTFDVPRGRAPALLACGALLVALAPACSSTANLRYAPRAIEQGLDAPGSDGPVARALVAVGQPSTDTAGRHELRLRLRLENLSDHPFSLEPDQLGLLTAELQEFGAVSVLPADDLLVPPRQSRTYELAFPYPDGFDPASAAGTSLNLRWGLRWEGHLLSASTDFRRQTIGEGGGGWWSPSWFSVGIGVQF